MSALYMHACPRKNLAKKNFPSYAKEACLRSFLTNVEAYSYSCLFHPRYQSKYYIFCWGIFIPALFLDSQNYASIISKPTEYIAAC